MIIIEATNQRVGQIRNLKITCSGAKSITGLFMAHQGFMLMCMDVCTEGVGQSDPTEQKILSNTKYKNKNRVLRYENVTLISLAQP